MRNLLIYLFILLTAIACKEIYESPVKPTATGYLVVEGVINSGPGETNITLSRTTSLDNRTIQYESGATVSIEGEDNSSRLLTSNPDGRYSGADLNLNSSTKYRLRIKTPDAKEYVSDFTPVKNNPPIDSISWKRENSGAQENGVQLYVSTHDPQNNTRYYQWDYLETWEYHAAFTSSLKYVITTLPSGREFYGVVFRFKNESDFDSTLYFCFHNRPSSSLVTGSSAKLSQDEIYKPFLFIPRGDERLAVMYSIKVKQYSLSKEGYEFLERMRKNSEQTGSVFDAQPSSINGNIHSVSDPSEPVIGFVSICPVQEKRFFLNNKQLEDWGYQKPICHETLDPIPNISDSIKARGIGLIPTNKPVCMEMICPTGIVKFLAASPECVDCSLSGGTPERPSYWPK
jgi:hypothetical protein